jgi:hypothetical protein
MGDFILSFKTAYPRPFVPRGFRLTKIEYPLAVGHAAVLQIKPDDAQVAFRIHYPARETFRFGAPFRADKAKGSIIELLVHENDIWWPYGGSLYSPWPDEYEGQRQSYRLTATEWREQVAQDRDLLRLVPRRTATVSSETESRFVLPDSRDEIFARVQSAFAKHYLVCGNYVYVRGGIPLYAQWKDRNYRTIVVTSSGCDRTIGPKQDLYVPPADYASPVTRQAFYEGRFWAPDAGEEIRRRLTKSQSEFAEIEVCIPRVVPGDLVRDVRVDALFREVNLQLSRVIFHTVMRQDVVDPLGARRWTPATRKFASTLQRTFREAVEPKTDSYATTVSRIEALRSILDCTLGLPKRSDDPPTVRACVRAFEEIDRLCPREQLAEEDAWALASLGL